MNKITLICLFLLFSIAGTVSAQFFPGDIGFQSSSANILKKNKVKTQTEIMRDSDSLSATVSVSTFNEDGYLLDTRYVNGEGDYEDRTDTIKDEYLQNGQGNIQKITMDGYDMYPIEIFYEYDKKGKLISSIIASAEAREYTYEYNDKGKIIKRVGKSPQFETDDEGNATEKLIYVDTDLYNYEWDDKGRLTTESFSMWNEFYNRSVYSYNNMGQITEMRVYYSQENDATPAFTIKYYYLNNGLLQKHITEEEGFMVEHYFEYTFFN